MPQYHKRVIIDESIIMPDHIHLLIELGNWDYDNGISMIGDMVEKIHEFSLLQHKPNPTMDELKKYRAERRRMIIPKILGKFQMLTSKQPNRQLAVSSAKLNQYFTQYTWQNKLATRLL